MNYLRGAVSAISAPYQYYKDINPSTLTGAIDVIVIRRPTDNGDSELVSSPFHVRFGKWQVLRPSDKKVNVFVNGTRIPFDMKIGEAGEAFFVFETDEDVPEDLITSPVLHPTAPPSDKIDEEASKAVQIAAELERSVEREPSFLDLNEGLQEMQNQDVWTTPKQTHYIPQGLRRQDSKATISLSTLPLVSSDDSDQRSNTTDSEMRRQDQRVAETLASFVTDLPPQPADVEYHHGSFSVVESIGRLIYPDHHIDITLDMEGYKQGYNHDREASDKTLRSSSHTHQEYNGGFSPASSPSQNRPSDIQSEFNSPYPTSPTSSSSSSSQPGSPYQGHASALRATSEPPPEIQIEPASPLVSSSQTPSMQEYSWEWGAFPQPSPQRASFGKGGRMDLRQTDRSRLSTLSHHAKLDEWKSDQLHSAHGRSRSVPPDLAGSPTRQNGRIYKEYEDFESENDPEMEGATREGRWERDSFPYVEWIGHSGCLGGQDDGSLVLAVDGKKFCFQLSLASFEDLKDGDDMGDLFDQYLVNFDRFMEDDSVVQDPRLVMRWGGHQYVYILSFLEFVLKTIDSYIRKKDGTPVLEALVRWRNATLAKRGEDNPRSSSSPGAPETPSSANELLYANGIASSDLVGPSVDHIETPKEPVTIKSSSSSWVQWWRSSRRNQSGRDAVSVCNLA